MRDLGVPSAVHGGFQGTAARLQSTPPGSEPLLILAALIAVYIVLGMLYESTFTPSLFFLLCLPQASAQSSQ